MKDIVKYRLFQNSDDFEQWQKDNDVQICAISPMASGGDYAVTSEVEGRIDVNVQVFVTYFDLSTPTNTDGE